MFEAGSGFTNLWYTNTEPAPATNQKMGERVMGDLLTGKGTTDEDKEDDVCEGDEVEDSGEGPLEVAAAIRAGWTLFWGVRWYSSRSHTRVHTLMLRQH